MSHVRKQVRDAVGVLLSANPTNWNHVFKTKITPQREVLPYLLVYIDNENIEALDISPAYLQLRDMQLIVRGRFRLVEGESLEDYLDDIAVEIETKLTTATLKAQLADKLKGFELVTINDDLITDDNERSYAEIVFEWHVKVMTTEGIPETLA
ncbi:MAG: hypothetical protein JAY90_18530 [Candidatus Thiodiazotropha lotti]|nr:hypothetical protein [Candidatus Thiodiazotropha lotti]